MRVTKQIKRLHKLVVAKLKSIKRELIAEKPVIDIYDSILGSKSEEGSEEVRQEAVQAAGAQEQPQEKKEETVTMQEQPGKVTTAKSSRSKTSQVKL